MRSFVSPTDYSDEVSRSMIDHRFGASGVPDLNREQIQRMVALREGARLYARHLIASAPPSWELDEALRALDNACSWACRAVSRNE